MIDHVGSPGHLGGFEPTEHATVFTSNYFENTMRHRRVNKETEYSELDRPAVRDRHHWPTIGKTGAKPVRFCALSVTFTFRKLRMLLELTAIDFAERERILRTSPEYSRDSERHVWVPGVRRDFEHFPHHRKLGFRPGA